MNEKDLPHLEMLDSHPACKVLTLCKTQELQIKLLPLKAERTHQEVELLAASLSAKNLHEVRSALLHTAMERTKCVSPVPRSGLSLGRVGGLPALVVSAASQSHGSSVSRPEVGIS